MKSNYKKKDSRAHKSSHQSKVKEEMKYASAFLHKQVFKLINPMLVKLRKNMFKSRSKLGRYNSSLHGGNFKFCLYISKIRLSVCVIDGRNTAPK